MQGEARATELAPVDPPGHRVRVRARARARARAKVRVRARVRVGVRVWVRVRERGGLGLERIDPPVAVAIDGAPEA